MYNPDLALLVNTTWDSKSGDRTIRVESAQQYLGESHLQILNLETRRASRITLAGLRRKFTQRVVSDLT